MSSGNRRNPPPKGSKPPPPGLPPFMRANIQPAESFDLKEFIKDMASVLTEEQQIQLVVKNKDYIRFIHGASEAVMNAHKMAHEL